MRTMTEIFEGTDPDEHPAITQEIQRLRMRGIAPQKLDSNKYYFVMNGRECILNGEEYIRTGKITYFVDEGRGKWKTYVLAAGAVYVLYRLIKGFIDIGTASDRADNNWMTG